MDYLEQLINIGADPERIAAWAPNYEGLYDLIMDECSEENFPVTVEDRRSMGDDMLYPTHDIFGNWEN